LKTTSAIYPHIEQPESDNRSALRIAKDHAFSHIDGIKQHYLSYLRPQALAKMLDHANELELPTHPYL
jgi:hypothetical protein